MKNLVFILTLLSFQAFAFDGQENETQSVTCKVVRPMKMMEAKEVVLKKIKIDTTGSYHSGTFEAFGDKYEAVLTHRMISGQDTAVLLLDILGENNVMKFRVTGGGSGVSQSEVIVQFFKLNPTDMISMSCKL